MHYSVVPFVDRKKEPSAPKSRGMEIIRGVFPDGKANEMNMLMLSTSGVHGSYMTLDEVEHILKTGHHPEYPDDKCEVEDGYYDITALIVHPRVVCLKYGQVYVRLEDIPFLRALVASSVEAMKDSQKGNLPKEVTS